MQGTAMAIDRAKLIRIAKILPLLNSDKPGEQQAAAEALAKFDMRDVAAVLQSTLPPAPSRYRYDERYARASF
jgi:hypothetical protein